MGLSDGTVAIVIHFDLLTLIVDKSCNTKSHFK